VRRGHSLPLRHSDRATVLTVYCNNTITFRCGLIFRRDVTFLLIFLFMFIRVHFLRLLFCMFVPSDFFYILNLLCFPLHNEAAAEFLICMLKTNSLCDPLHNPPSLAQPFSGTNPLPLAGPRRMGEMTVNRFASADDASWT
jgi:hypothetical protein